jgi:hypothetical protein
MRQMKSAPVVLVTIILVMIVLAKFASAQDAPRLEVFGGYSFERISACGSSGSMNFSLCHAAEGTAEANNYNGWNAAGTVFAYKFLGFTADFAGHYGTTGVSGASASFGPFTSRYSYMFGPVAAVRNKTYAPFAHVLFGRITNNFGSNGVSSYANFTWAIGGGIDVAVSQRWAIRMVQFDYERANEPASSGSNSAANGFRLSTGAVFRF